MELTYEQSVEAAKPIKQMAELARTLNVEYLERAVLDMKKNHSMREAAMVMNPNPHTAIEVSDLEAEKLKGLELMLELARNQDRIFDLTVKLEKAKMNSRKLSDFFGQ